MAISPPVVAACCTINRDDKYESLKRYVSAWVKVSEIALQRGSLSLVIKTTCTPYGMELAPSGTRLPGDHRASSLTPLFMTTQIPKIKN
jgi:hypothetical protein